ncbi:TPA: hypothetical protein DEP30_02280 [Candidatus Nomurabacteria bacterium]|nr:MAG: SppA protein [Candidatus Nomurabacteria bacterium GW2011_GWE2_36_115]KKP94096.1 MAG: SppA protein [Candidatus Nomurabacteria bacterium GW2011_GWF2_36_126]KKP96776.1 MAG: SppA protein [Candidatus Nomurabacteria bacterium GW2011_GWD2_36_14]KKP99620.1 MAG: SppA protein [Candidatus Nomurabacteria bacterium GW2011_GWF2_36_19]KKQ05464.1 MAG: SppA protein [Candidatus Nomurabacteria bacterium GW2011_GWF1_36_47]KKQ09622.1 MAG: SppA protein [Candidatus Nomurabacteria bacterium GW2011_GWB1_36_6]
MAKEEKQIIENNSKNGVNEKIPNNEDSAQNKKVEEEISPLKKLLKKSDVLLMLYPKDINGNFSASIDPEDEISIYKLLKEKKEKKKELLILLDTSGGNVYSAVKIMDTLRTQYNQINIAIPQEAKSSGTMMCCGANNLIMSSISELGPLDKPMIHPNDETARISALDIIKSIDGMLDTAQQREKDFAKEVNNDFGIPIKQSLQLASESISKLISPMLCREDVKIYNQAQRLLVIAQKYATELLDAHMLKYIDRKKLKERIIDMTTRQLIWAYPDHSFAIRRDELREWFFIVKNSEDVDYWDELWDKFYQNIGYKNSKLIKFLDN